MRVFRCGAGGLPRPLQNLWTAPARTGPCRRTLKLFEDALRRVTYLPLNPPTTDQPLFIWLIRLQRDHLGAGR